MRKIILLAMFISGLAHSQESVKAVNLLLETKPLTESDAGNLVSLRGPQGCRYIGTLRHNQGLPESWLTKLFNQAGGDAATWSVQISSRICPIGDKEVREEVRMVAPLRNLRYTNYRGNESVTAYTVNE